MSTDRRQTRGQPRPAGWEDIKARLASAREALDRDVAGRLDAEAVLESRARLLARKPASGEQGEELEIVEFSMRGRRYAFEAAMVREVASLTTFSRLPGAPPVVLGLVNVRGDILSLLDLHLLLGLPTGSDRVGELVVLQREGISLAVLIDSLEGTRSVSAASFEEAPEGSPGTRSRIVQGIAGDGLVLLGAGSILTDLSTGLE